MSHYSDTHSKLIGYLLWLIGFFGAHRFRSPVSNPTHAIFKRTGTQNPWTTVAPEGEQVPVELAVAESQNGLLLHMRYETFVLFDTGDLKRFADELAGHLAQQTTTAEQH